MVWFEGKPLIQPAPHKAQPALIPGDSGKQICSRLVSLPCLLSLIPRFTQSHSQVYSVSFPSLLHSHVYLVSFPDLLHSHVCLVSFPGLQSHSQVYSGSFPGLLGLIPRSTHSHSQVYSIPSPSLPGLPSLTPRFSSLILRSIQFHSQPGLLVRLLK